MIQAQINRMLQDNMMILDTALSAVSSAEKLVLESKKEKNMDIMMKMILLHGEQKKN